jgi:metallo-beta-lactamase class B
MRRLTKGNVAVLILALSIAPMVFLGRLWKTTVDRNGPGPAEPFRIAGNFYYVGADAVSAFLITGPEGHVVLDGGYPANAPMIIASIAQLGFDIKDVKVLLNSTPFREQAGGLAALQQASGAKLWASDASAPVLASGGDNADFALPIRTLFQVGVLSYTPARVDHRFKDGDTIRVGPVALTAHITGGSARGCTSWSLSVRDGERLLNVVSVCPLGMMGLGMRYPEQRAQIERSLRVLRSLPAHIWVTASSRAWGRYTKFVASKAAKNPADAFIDPDGYHAYIDNAEAEFRQGVMP